MELWNTSNHGWNCTPILHCIHCLGVGLQPAMISMVRINTFHTGHTDVTICAGRESVPVIVLPRYIISCYNSSEALSVMNFFNKDEVGVNGEVEDWTAGCFMMITIMTSNM